MKKTPFYEKHIEMGGRMVEFAGFYMPIQYKGVVKEVLSVRERVGIFDVSHMGEIKIT
ncbi:MAG: glycine cleavage system aminomethyltransferase GcvT, partial [bacterium (Candidatus Stahlbacteria) CG08_land_8_20_14_0_20_40_26]